MNATVSQKAAHLIGSEIIRLGQEINQKIRAGEAIHNLTIGDFNPKIFPIPDALKRHIIDAYLADETNYPPADGIPELKRSIRDFLGRHEHLEIADDELMVAGGGRPLIYAIYQAIVDPGDRVIYPVPSWNNNHYCYLSDAVGVEIATLPENDFMPTAEEIEPFIHDATMLALCSPLNPTGTTFNGEQLGRICDLVIAENTRRAGIRKPLYVLYDQIYWMLRANGIEHVNPVALRPEMKPYTIFVDGISKSFAATGVRVGWSVGPANVIGKMKSILGHIGAWAPKAEQVATTHFLNDTEAVSDFLTEIKNKIESRFNGLYQGITHLNKMGYPVRVIRPEGAIYITAQFSLIGKRMTNGHVIEGTADITKFLLDNARLAVVPFTAFGCEQGTDWYRISVGTLGEDDLPGLLQDLEAALATLSPN